MPRFLPAFVFAAAAACAQVPEAATKMVLTHQAWGPKASTKNASLTIREASRSGQTVTVRLYAKGLPANGVLTLMNWPITEQNPVETMRGISLGPDGIAMANGKPVEVSVTPLPGEPLRLGLVSADRAAMAFAEMSPIPIQAEDRGCTLQATLLTPGAEMLLIEGSGFPPNAEYTTESNSEGERQAGRNKAGPDGKFSFAVLPYKEGLAKGTIVIGVKVPQCSPSITVPWGRRFRTR